MAWRHGDMVALATAITYAMYYVSYADEALGQFMSFTGGLQEHRNCIMKQFGAPPPYRTAAAALAAPPRLRPPPRATEPPPAGGAESLSQIKKLPLWLIDAYSKLIWGSEHVKKLFVPLYLLPNSGVGQAMFLIRPVMQYLRLIYQWIAWNLVKPAHA